MSCLDTGEDEDPDPCEDAHEALGLSEACHETCTAGPETCDEFTELTSADGCAYGCTVAGGADESIYAACIEPMALELGCSDSGGGTAPAVTEAKMEMSFAEALDADQQTEACDALVSDMMAVEYVTHVECDMEQRSRRSRHLLAVTYDVTLTVEVAASNLDAFLADVFTEELLTDTVANNDALATLNGGEAPGITVDELDGVAVDPVDEEESGAAINSAAMVSLAVGAALAVVL